MVSCKSVLKNWHKGTGGGSGVSSKFEGWSDAKLEKYGVDLDVYDHSDVPCRLAVLITNNCKQKTPYLIVIYLWEKKGGLTFIITS